MHLRHYWNLLLKRSKAIKPAKITFSNVKAVIQSLFRRGRELCNMELPLHMYEQIIWRRTQVQMKSPECWDRQECKVCGCEILGKTMEDRACSADEVGLPQCYPPMMGKTQWKIYKEVHGIKLFD